MSLISRRSLLQSSAGALSLSGLASAMQQNTTPYQRPKLKITDVRTAYVTVHGPQLHVRIYTDQGLIGQGEATDSALGGAAIIAGFRRFLVGQNPLNVEAIWERIRTAGVFAGAQSGQYITALTGIEIALWDLCGKAVGLPVYQLLGGKVRDKVRIYCDSANHHPDDPLAKQKLNEIEKMGFTAAKIDIDEAMDPNRFDRVNWTANNAEIDRMVKEVAFVRETLGKQVELAVDMHGRYDATTGKRVAIELEPFRLLWLEEPVPAENIDAMRDIRQSTKTPICCGENLFLRHGFREVLEKRAADIIMPDIQKCGGLLESRKIADMAHTYYVPFAPHCVVSPIGTMASCHVCAAVPNFLVLEWHWISRLPLWRDFVKEGEIIEKGYVTVTDRPGLGVEMNEEAARKSQMPGSKWFEA
ncbi:mandelate racemase/muconate lactonizing enzyme family protein [Paludibaculum fermentans]|uniref:mandelate racemase/muconate lactonizing enzyme family protein n=1 Tax=Paludibaculum fermentans TaxID=1473598 RepID=UPI003EBCC4D9